jgi:uncharacterized sulfatase
LEGASLAPLLTKPDAPWDRPARSMVHHQGAVGKTVTNERYRYTEWDGGKRGVELYDHQADAGEYKNLADDPAYAAARDGMKRLLLP